MNYKTVSPYTRVPYHGNKMLSLCFRGDRINHYRRYLRADCRNCGGDGFSCEGGKCPACGGEGAA